jgi:hypothetical protein
LLQFDCLTEMGVNEFRASLDCASPLALWDRGATPRNAA